MKRSILFPARFIDSIPKITTTSLPAANQFQPYSAQLQGTGGTYPVLWSATITPNTGGQFSLNTVTGVISGTPGTVENETFVVQYTDSRTPHNTAQATFTVAVNSTVTITTSSLPTGTAGVSYNTTLAATGGTLPYTWAMSPTNLDGLTLSSAGVLSGTPTSATTATATFTVTDAMNIPSAPVSLQFTAGAAGTNAPSAMWPGVVTSNRIMVSWWPVNDGSIGTTSQNVPADPNTYNLYRNGVKVASGLVPLTRGGGSLKTYAYEDLGLDIGPAGLAPSTTYNYQVTSVSPSNTESVFGPTYTVTTLAGSSTPPTPPTPVTDPTTWIQPFALPTGNVWIVDQNVDVGGVKSYNIPGSASSGTATNNVHCGLQFALNNCNIAGGDIIVLTAGLVFPTPAGNFQAPAFTGVNGWTYIISSEDPVYKAGGILPAYEFNPNTQAFTLTCTGSLVVGAVNAQLTAPWTRKTGIYPVHFSTAEERYVKFTNGQTLISWNINNYMGTPQNPYGWTGSAPTVGAGLAQAASATIGVNYLPGITLSDVPALPVIHFGGPGTNGGGLSLSTLGTNKLRIVGIWFKPVPGVQSANFSGLSVGTGLAGPGLYQNIYTDRCMFGCDTTTYTSTGAPNFTATGDYGNVIHGIDALYCDNQLAHGCYFQCAQPQSNPGQDSQGLFCRGGGPLCIQNCYLEAIAEGFIAGGAAIPQNNIPHDLTYRYNYNCKPLWWAWGSLQTFLNAPSHVTGTTGQIAVSSSQLLTVGELITISGTNTGTGSIVGYLNPTTYKISAVSNNNVMTLTTQAGAALTTTVGTLTGLALQLPSGAYLGTAFYFGDYVKNNFELKCMIRAHVYGNTNQNSFNTSGSPGQGVSIGIGARDQVSAGAAKLWDTCPWAKITDVDVHDNVSWQGGRALTTFGVLGDPCPSTFTTRVRYHNNMSLTMNVQSNTDNGVTTSFPGNGPGSTYLHPGSGSQLFDYQDNGILADIICDHNTFITDFRFGFYGETYNGEQKSYMPVADFAVVAGTTNPNNYDRHQLTNNIFVGAIKGTAPAGGNPFLTDPRFTNLTWANNLLQNDNTSPLPAGVVYRPPAGAGQVIAFNTMGFANFVDSRHQPLQPSDWNITSGTYATADTTGGAVGATFAAPAALQFPLLGAVFYGSSTNITPAQAAKFGVIQLGVFPGWTNGGLNPGQWANAIKAINPKSTVWSYTLIEGNATNPPGDNNLALIPQVPWWLYQAGTSGTIVQLGGGFEINITTNSLVHNGQTYPVWRAGSDVAEVLTPWPGINGLFVDNVFSVPRVNGDWTRVGSSQNASDATTQHNYRLGYVTYFAAVRAAAAATQQQILGNVADWYTNNFGLANVTDYQGLLNGGQMEGINGQESANGWSGMMTDYSTIMSTFAPPQYGMFSVNGTSATNYVGARYFYCSCLLHNGYFLYSVGGGYSYPSTLQLDEFNFNLGTPIPGPNNLGNGVYGAGLSAYQNGVWRRDFQNGIALVNPRGNGVKSVTLEIDVWRLRGTQDNVTNSGAKITAGTAISMADSNVVGNGGSGLVLSRTLT